ncbi:MAG: hypothetical protein FWC77_03745 [Defluviitaleaceae bacterium]|nr:hypothetical protein [Defluviitaleaceae bacterium]
MKKIAICILLLGMIFVLAACGDGADVNEPEEYIAATPANTNDETHHDDTNDNEPYNNASNTEEYEPEHPHNSPLRGFALVYNDVTIQMDDDISYLLPMLGEPLGIFEAPSCAFDGIDRIFGFRGIQIHTYPDGDLDRVHTISFINDSITTMAGITLGHSRSDVLAAYGNDYEQDTGMFVFTDNGTTLSFFIEDDEVAGIIYGLIMD